MRFLNLFKKNKPAKRLAIIDVTDGSFKRQVLNRSYKTAVMVDFWAPWCGPCRQLGPVLEKIAEDPTSDFILAKLNTEDNQRTAARHNIRSIPAVKVFRNGQVIGEFTGARPEPLVRRFLQDLMAAPLPSPRIKRSADPARRIQQAEHHLKNGKGLESFVMLQDFPQGPYAARAEALLPLARFLLDIDDGDGLTGLDALDEQYQAAAKSMQRKNPSKALDHLVKALEVGEEMDRAVTEQIIDSLFALLGEDSQLAEAYRRKLSQLDANMAE